MFIYPWNVTERTSYLKSLFFAVKRNKEENINLKFCVFEHIVNFMHYHKIFRHKVWSVGGMEDNLIYGCLSQEVSPKYI